MSGETYKIVIRDHAIPCKEYSARNLPYPLHSQLDSMVTEGIIEPIPDPTEWLSPIVCVPKKDSDSIRMCVDFPQLNKGYHQVELDENSRDHTCFLTPFGRYRFKHGTLQTLLRYNVHFRLLQKTHVQGIVRNTMSLVVDDCLIYGRTPAEHNANVIRFLDKCRERGIRLNREKFVYAQTEIEFAGLILSERGFQTHHDTVKSIMDFPSPRT